MATTNPDDIAALFDLPPPTAAPSTPGDADALAAAQAELASELALTMASGGVAADAPDSRTDPRVGVAWPARMRLPDGHVIRLEVRNVSQLGVGLMSADHMPARTVVEFEMDVPALDAVDETTRVTGALETTYTVAHGSTNLCGGTWQAPPDGWGLVQAWIARLRG